MHARNFSPAEQHSNRIRTSLGALVLLAIGPATLWADVDPATQPSVGAQVVVQGALGGSIPAWVGMTDGLPAAGKVPGRRRAVESDVPDLLQSRYRRTASKPGDRPFRLGFREFFSGWQGGWEDLELLVSQNKVGALEARFETDWDVYWTRLEREALMQRARQAAEADASATNIAGLSALLARTTTGWADGTVSETHFEADSAADTILPRYSLLNDDTAPGATILNVAPVPISEQFAEVSITSAGPLPWYGVPIDAGSIALTVPARANGKSSDSLIVKGPLTASLPAAWNSIVNFPAAQNVAPASFTPVVTDRSSIPVAPTVASVAVFQPVSTGPAVATAAGSAPSLGKQGAGQNTVASGGTSSPGNASGSTSGSATGSASDGASGSGSGSAAGSASSGATSHSSVGRRSVQAPVAPPPVVIYVSNFNPNTSVGSVNEYNGTTGAPITFTSPVGTSSLPAGLAIGGLTILYVADQSTGTVGAYNLNTSAAIPGFTTITGLNTPTGVALAGNTLYVADIGNATVKAYNATTGAAMSFAPSGMTGPTFISVSANVLYVADFGGNKILAYNATTGAAASGITVPTVPGVNGLTVSGNVLWVADSSLGTVKAYNATTGTALGPSISGFKNPGGLAVFGNLLYIEDSDENANSITVYNTTSNTVVSTFTDPSIQAPYGIAAIPEPGSGLLLAVGIGALLGWRRRKSRI